MLQSTLRASMFKLLCLVESVLYFMGVYPFWPGLGALLLNVRVCLCLNLGGPFLGVVGPVAPPGASALPAGGLAFISEESLFLIFFNLLDLVPVQEARWCCSDDGCTLLV
uniref:Uncharacterized protein n=1 Tax=Oryzias latipes TaxID=8090 RepID=A0A3P9LV42_ORYLA